jgi:hypothetical protein
MIIGSGLLALIWVVVWIVGFVDALLAEPSRVRVLPKALWIVLILIFGALAAVPWFIFGRPLAGVAPGPRPSPGAFFGRPFGGSPAEHPSSRDATGRDAGVSGWQLGGAGGTRRSGPIAPDDDPEFLRRIGKPRPDDPNVNPNP